MFVQFSMNSLQIGKHRRKLLSSLTSFGEKMKKKETGN